MAGAVRGDITAEKVDIRTTGRVWGNVVTAAFATEEGAFLRGQIRWKSTSMWTRLPPRLKRRCHREMVKVGDEAIRQQGN